MGIRSWYSNQDVKHGDIVKFSTDYDYSTSVLLKTPGVMEAEYMAIIGDGSEYLHDYEIQLYMLKKESELVDTYTRVLAVSSRAACLIKTGKSVDEKSMLVAGSENAKNGNGEISTILVGKRRSEKCTR